MTNTFKNRWGFWYIGSCNHFQQLSIKREIRFHNGFNISCENCKKKQTKAHANTWELCFDIFILQRCYFRIRTFIARCALNKSLNNNLLRNAMI